MGAGLSLPGFGNALFQEGALAKVPVGSVKILPGTKVDSGFTSPVLVITKAVRANMEPGWVEDDWIRATRGEVKDGCCDNCYKKCYWCFLNCVCCNIPNCSQDCNKCIAKYCCTPPFERRHFGMTQLTMTVPLTDVIQVTSTTRVVKRDDEIFGKGGKPISVGTGCCDCFDQYDPRKDTKVAPTAIKCGPEDHKLVGIPESEFAKKIKRSERHVVVRVRYLPNHNKYTGSNFKDISADKRGDAHGKSESSIDYVDVSLFASNEWTSAEWDAKCAEARTLVESVTMLKQIMQTGRNPTPDEVVALSKPGQEILSYSGLPERPEKLTYGGDSKVAF